MRFMIIVKATPESEAGAMPDEALMQAMAGYHEELAKAGVLVDASGLRPSSQAWRIDYDGERRTFTDGPFMETKELVAGFTVIDVKSREEAIEWTMRFPNPAVDHGRAQIEVRPYFELEDFGDSATLDRCREIGIDPKKK